MSVQELNVLQDALASIRPQDAVFRAKAKARLDQLTMPHWAMGRLLDLAVDLAGMTRSLRPPLARKAIITMAADHGVAAEGVSKYPAEVTAQMVRNFVAGGAAINAMAKLAGAKVVVVDMGVAADLSDLAAGNAIISRPIAPGAANIARGPAMTAAQARAAVQTGIRIAASLAPEVDVFGTGDMGIGNTTPSAAVASVLTGASPAQVTGRGTGVDDARFARKVAVVQKAIDVNRPDPTDGLDVLAKVGGFEIGGIAGVILGAAAAGKPVLVDGFISTAGALIAMSLSPTAGDYVIAAHRSVEPGHAAMHRMLNKQPLLDLSLRLGEGTGAALAMHLVEAAGRLLTDVATFDEAAVSKADR